VQSFYAVAKPLGDTRPAWKVLRVLGNLLKLDGFDQDSSEAVREEALGGKPEFVAGLDNALNGVAASLVGKPAAIERIADVPSYFADPLVRRAPSLQATKDAAAPTARMNAATMAKLRVATGAQVKISAGAAPTVLLVRLDTGVPDDCLRVAAAHPSTINLGAPGGALTVEPV
jgi:NADH-quinone oxidoreductase subunit G